MESASTHHHQIQDQLVGSPASSLATPSSYAWPPPSFFETKQPENSSAVSSSQLYMAPDIAAYNWANNNATTNHDSDQQHCSRIKEDLLDQYYRRYTDILSTNIPQSTTTDLQRNDVATKFLLKSFSYGNLISTNANARGFAQILPSLNVSSFNPTADMNLEALDLLPNSSIFSGNFVTCSQNQIGILRDGFSSYGFDHMQQSHQAPFHASNKVSSASIDEVVEAKRNSAKTEPKSQFQNVPKKSRLEARSSCPPFKVRKEKLGDRIAALQQLVAPFGKTDTASVLMEAIGYIKFLQSQVETLSVPYMKASRNKPNRVTKGGLDENENGESKRDLKSRGLCLIPLSCLSYITDGGGAAVWPPPHFGGGT